MKIRASEFNQPMETLKKKLATQMAKLNTAIDRRKGKGDLTLNARRKLAQTSNILQNPDAEKYHLVTLLHNNKEELKRLKERS